MCISGVCPGLGVQPEEVVSEPGFERGLRAGQVEEEAWVVWPVVLKLFGPRLPSHTCKFPHLP